MRYSEATEAVRIGRQVARMGWSRDARLVMLREVVTVQTGRMNEVPCPYHPTADDRVAMDWYEVPT